MKKSVLSVLAIAALMVGMISCNGAKKSNEAENTEEAAVIAGKARKLLNSWLICRSQKFLIVCPAVKFR